jgi:hypothetical protein
VWEGGKIRSRPIQVFNVVFEKQKAVFGFSIRFSEPKKRFSGFRVFMAYRGLKS